MIKIFLGFLIVWASVVIGISSWRSLSNKEKFTTIKTAVYGFLTATIAFIILTTIVILF